MLRTPEPYPEISNPNAIYKAPRPRDLLPKRQRVADTLGTHGRSWIEYSSYAVDRPYISMNDPCIDRVEWLTAKSLGEDALKKASEQYENDRTSLENGEGDAFRHALWNYKMAKELGPEATKAFADAYERSHPNSDEVRMMDLFNNEIGRRLAQDPSNQGKSDEEIIREAIRSGKLQTRPFTVPGPNGRPNGPVFR